jgi:small-conductance mechanosensitive channel
MYAFDRMCRALAACLLAVAVVAAAPTFAQGKSSKPKHDPTTLPEPLTHDSIRELVSRLSDEDVRKLLINQLDRAAVPGKGKDAAMSGMVEHNAGMIRERSSELKDAFLAFPTTLREVVAKLDEPDGPSVLGLLAALIVGILLIGWVAERIYHRALRNYRKRLGPPATESFSARAFRLGMVLVLDLVGILIFALAALATFLALWQGHGLRRIAIIEILIGVVAVRVTALFARFLLSKQNGNERLLPFTDQPAGQLRWFAILVATLWAVGHFVQAVLAGGGASPQTLDLVVFFTTIVGFVIVVTTVWLVRVPIANLIRGDKQHNTVVGWLADLWPVIATVFFAAIVATRVFDILSGTPVAAGAGILSVLLVVALPIVDLLLCRAVAAAASKPPAEPAPLLVPSTAPEGMAAQSGPRDEDGAFEQDGPPPQFVVAAQVAAQSAQSRPARQGFVAAYEAVFRRAIHIVVLVIGLFLLAELWDVDLFAVAQSSMGGKISSSLFGICIVLLLSYLLWELAKTAIDRRLAAEGKQGPDVPASRLQTLLPLLRALILITIIVMATMSFLAALGVDILPLLAGASVVGVAIGFGSQTLVRDIVSGAFFLMDDAFRLGEYIEVGSDKGVVEKINVRSVFLRHHRGALNILPYGEIKRLRNTSRDWIIHVMEFRLTYDTNIQLVKKIMKKIGQEMQADPDYASDMLQPLKSQGVLATEDSAIVIRAKFTAKPGGNSFVIRRVAYDKILKAFREAGIKFAHKEVTVNVQDVDDDIVKAAAGAAARATMAEPKPPTG